MDSNNLYKRWFALPRAERARDQHHSFTLRSCVRFFIRRLRLLVGGFFFGLVAGAVVFLVAPTRFFSTVDFVTQLSQNEGAKTLDVDQINKNLKRAFAGTAYAQLFAKVFSDTISGSQTEDSASREAAEWFVNTFRGYASQSNNHSTSWELAVDGMALYLMGPFNELLTQPRFAQKPDLPIALGAIETTNIRLFLNYREKGISKVVVPAVATAMNQMAKSYNADTLRHSNDLVKDITSQAMKTFIGARAAFLFRESKLEAERVELRVAIAASLRDTEKLAKKNRKAGDFAQLQQSIEYRLQSPARLNSFSRVTLESLQMDLILHRLAAADLASVPIKVIERISADVGSIERTRVDLESRQRASEKEYHDAEDRYTRELSQAKARLTDIRDTLVPSVRIDPPLLYAALNSEESTRPPLFKFLVRGAALGFLAALMIALTLENFKFSVAQNQK